MQFAVFVPGVSAFPGRLGFPASRRHGVPASWRRGRFDRPACTRVLASLTVLSAPASLPPRRPSAPASLQPRPLRPPRRSPPPWHLDRTSHGFGQRYDLRVGDVALDHCESWNKCNPRAVTSRFGPDVAATAQILTDESGIWIRSRMRESRPKSFSQSENLYLPGEGFRKWWDCASLQEGLGAGWMGVATELVSVPTPSRTRRFSHTRRENRIRSRMREPRPKSFSQVRTCACRVKAFGSGGIARARKKALERGGWG